MKPKDDINHKPIIESTKFSTIGLICFSMLIASSGLSLLGLIEANELESQEITAFWNGVSTMLLYLFAAIIALYCGKLINRVGIKKIVIAGMVVMLINTLLHLFTMHYAAIFVYRILTGIGASLTFVATESWLVLLSNSTNVSRNLAIYGMSMALGFAFAPLGPMLYHSHGIGFITGNQLPFLITMVLMIGALVWLIMFTRDPTHIEFRDLPLRNWFKKIPIPSLAAILYGVMEAVILAQLFYFGRSIDLSVEESNWLVFFPLAAGILTIIPSGIIADKWGRLKLIRLYAAVGTVSLFLIVLFIPDFIWIGVMMFIAGITVDSLYALGLSLISEHVPMEEIAYANGFFTTMYGIGSVTGPIITGALITYVSPQSLFIFLGAISITFFLMSLRSNK